MEEKTTASSPLVSQPPVQPAPPRDSIDSDPEIEAKPAAPKPAKVPAKKAAKGSGTGMAVAATVIIVLGLAALATYAYLQTK